MALKIEKNNEKTARVKYLRNLEKFANSAVNVLKKSDFEKEKFEERMLKNAKIFENCEAVWLNSNYAKKLEEFANLCLDFSKNRSELLAFANSLDKLKNGERKKKHKKILEDF